MNSAFALPSLRLRWLDNIAYWFFACYCDIITLTTNRPDHSATCMIPQGRHGTVRLAVRGHHSPLSVTLTCAINLSSAGR